MATRINKYLSEIGHCSRRGADKLLEQGRITRPIAKARNAQLQNMSRASRDSEIEVVNSLINVFGGKWTSARHLGRKVASVI